LQTNSYTLDFIRVVTLKYQECPHPNTGSYPWIGPKEVGVEEKIYLNDQLKMAYREAFRQFILNGVALDWMQENIRPEASQSLVFFYSLIHHLESLMIGRLTISPEEEIQRTKMLRSIWIKEKRLQNTLTQLTVSAV